MEYMDSQMQARYDAADAAEREEILTEAFNKAQAELIDSFKTKLKSAAEDVLGTMYADVANYAATDAHVNYHNFIRDEFRKSLTKEIAEGYGQYSWAHGVRMTLLEKYPDVLRNKIISDLQERVKSLEEHNEQLRRSRY